MSDEQQYYDEILGPREEPHVRWIGEDKAQVNRTDDPLAEWTAEYDNWPLGDRMADGSDDQPYEEDE